MNLFLHEEIIEILATANREMTVREIHQNIKHYRRKDGKFPPVYQVHAHILDYPQHFYVNRDTKPHKIGLKEWRSDAKLL